MFKIIKYCINILFIGFVFSSFGKNTTYQDVLTSQYAKCLKDKEIIYLTSKQSLKIEKMSEIKILSKIKIRFRNHCNKSNIYIDSHLVRTLNETVLFEIKENKILKIFVSSFMEPQEYKAPLKWLATFTNKKIDNNLRVGSGVDALSGATLTANAMVDASRKFLALDFVLSEK